MNCYEPSMPRAKLGFAAVAMTSITMSMMVLLPAMLDSPGTGQLTLATAGGATRASAGIDSRLARANLPAVKLENQRPTGSYGQMNRQ